MCSKLRKDDINKFYDIREQLGTGSFAVVKRGVRKTDQHPFAVKIIKKSKLNADELAVVHDEVEIMHKIAHVNCVQLFEMFETNKKIYMVMELLTGGELFDRIVSKGSYSEKEASEVTANVTSAIQYLHNTGIVHRDLKVTHTHTHTPRTAHTVDSLQQAGGSQAGARWSGWPARLLFFRRRLFPSILVRCLSLTVHCLSTYCSMCAVLLSPKISSTCRPTSTRQSRSLTSAWPSSAQPSRPTPA